MEMICAMREEERQWNTRCEKTEGESGIEEGQDSPSAAYHHC